MPSTGETFMADQFKSKVKRTVASLNNVLGSLRTACVADECHHEYADKYALADFLTNCSLAATINSLAALGLDEHKLRTLHDAAQHGTVTLRLTADETCSFVRSTKREIEADTKRVETGWLGNHESKVVTVLTEHLWRRGVSYEIVAQAHSSMNPRLMLLPASQTLES